MVQHPDPDDLTMLALGEQIDIAVEGHLDRCEQCRAEVDAMRMTVELAELSNYGEATRQPGEHIWDAIVAELGVDAAPRTNGSAQAGTDHVIGLDSEIVADGQFRSDTVPGTGPPDSSPPVIAMPRLAASVNEAVVWSVPPPKVSWPAVGALGTVPRTPSDAIARVPALMRVNPV